MNISKFLSGNYEVIRLESSTLSVDVAPAVGGKIISIYSKALSQEFLWTNDALTLQSYAVGTSFDPFFFGGFDELLPCDMPEIVQGIDYPDHGELWTLDLNYQTNSNELRLFKKLPLSELYYEKIITIDESAPFIHIDYIIRNDAPSVRNFLWKLHAALKIQEGDQMECFIGKGQVADPEYSRFKSLKPFTWPIIEGTDASKVPAKNGTMDFYYLYDIYKGEMSLISSSNNSRFTYFFDTKVFPYLWYFASYGGFLGHYTVIFEPCTTMPISVNEAFDLKQCSVLQPTETIKTRVSIYAGSLNHPSENLKK
jgi:hypothetical protein